ncbi:hypothetical protein ES703_68684 [subsurface metagenome]
MVIRIKKPILETDRFTPEPLMDWAEIRKAKVRCEQHCALFDHLLGGGCSLGLLPSMQCEQFKRIIRKRRSGSAAERLFSNEGTGSSPASRSKITDSISPLL